jgi:hypothetical protein
VPIRNLDQPLEPASVAVLGASSRVGSVDSVVEAQGGPHRGLASRTPNDGGRRKQPSTIFVANGRSTSELDFADIVSESVACGRSRWQPTTGVHSDERLHQNAANWYYRPSADLRRDGLSVSIAAEMCRSGMCDELTHPALTSHPPMTAVRPARRRCPQR